MARSSKTVPKVPAQLNRGQLQLGIDRLAKVLNRVREFAPQSVTEQFKIPHVEQLSAAIDDALVRTFGHDSIDYDRYRSATEFDNGPFNYAYEVPIHEVHESLARSKARNVALLEQAIESLRERLAEDEVLSEPTDLPYAVSRQQVSPGAASTDKIFIVHGHAGELREAVARFLERLGFEPIILHEQANQGKTIIEKFESHADVGFAVILLTPDDVGAPSGGQQRPRPRQNVILELGYFIGRLGRGRVCALKAGDIEMPSDILGIVWTHFDAGGAWKLGLAKELQAAKYPVDWNKVMA
jgi:predicted nucleotide-binding protein